MSLHQLRPATDAPWLAAHVPAWVRQAEVFITRDTGNPDAPSGREHQSAVLPATASRGPDARTPVRL